MTRRPPFNRCRPLADESGAILVVFALMLAIFAGIMALSYDFGRVAATQSEMQSFADTVALAAAGELDGGPDAIERAERAATTLITDLQTYGDGGATLDADDITLAFYALRPDAQGAVAQTSTPQAARFVSVRLDDRGVAPVFGAVFAALGGDTAGRDTAGAHAVAGFTRYACNVTPLMICAPSASFDISANVGRSLDLHLAADAGQLAAGAIAPLDPVADLIGLDGVCAGLSGIGLDICMIAGEADKPVCLADDGVSVRDSLLSVSLDAALNIPFDIYDGPAGDLLGDALYPAASNVLSSFAPSAGSCLTSSNATLGASLGLPLDDCQSGGSCGVLGDGDWATGRDLYIEANYGGDDPHPEAETRFDLYVAELEAALEGDTGSGSGGLVGGLLGGVGDVLDLDVGPTCTPETSEDPARRVISAAVVDCGANAVTAGSRDVPVLGYAELFLMAPVGLDGTDGLAVEIVGQIGPSPADNVTGAALRDVVRLYD
ncbi:pilus assembly protein TadG-related protein [Maritimibacter sp. UBA3975]|uniref:pilus assembly protein TadG-related protein n=1 Tax=Maritimibacter sp. UBA3975 TaxID=1946833 RepID=UPI000C0904BD|nr:pilus assembly protein TadG-related protein [Maritimibacter sp. UBA3975]MAM62281.1 hypothetical protein [Maritimibacter sp.]|tara:strand:- start:657 stop:2132 length:1476 start_codon:yes stop_codon:yes gene_type:complete